MTLSGALCFVSHESVHACVCIFIASCFYLQNDTNLKFPSHFSYLCNNLNCMSQRALMHQIILFSSLKTMQIRRAHHVLHLKVAFAPFGHYYLHIFLNLVSSLSYLIHIIITVVNQKTMFCITFALYWVCVILFE